ARGRAARAGLTRAPSATIVDTLQYAELFLTESREHVAAVNQALLLLERQATGPAASDAVDEIFRAVHTVKGMSAMMGYAVVAELSHELESVLDKVRRGALSIDGDMMDAFFHGADLLERSIETAVSGREGEVDTADLVATLHRLG